VTKEPEDILKEWKKRGKGVEGKDGDAIEAIRYPGIPTFPCEQRHKLYSR
jgi:hypothetical protein